MLCRISALLRAAADAIDGRPGRYLSGRAKTRPAAVPVPVPAAPVDPDFLVMFVRIDLDQDEKLFCKLTMDRAYMSNEGYAGDIMRRIRRYFDVRHRTVTDIRLLSYDQYLEGVASCPDKTPEDLHV